MKSQIIYSQALPGPNHFPGETVLFYDSILAKKREFKKWSARFKYKIALESGEKLKTIDSLQTVLNKISRLKVEKTTALTFVAIGGGSIGDFVGFLSSVFLRGRKLILIPSTWLAAADSSHGGKNGLNFSGTKNQIGTFYFPVKIYICRSLLLSQPSERLTESLGEVVKAAVLGDRNLFLKLEKEPDGATLYRLLPKIIGIKNRIVQSDFLEKNGKRRLLNLGHTMGHVFESHFGFPHGIAVLLGLQFAARWSLHCGLLLPQEFFRISMLIDSMNLKENLNTALQKIKPPTVARLLSHDKKLTTGDRLDFIHIRRIGRCERKSVTIGQILDEVKRQTLEY